MLHLYDHIAPALGEPKYSAANPAGSDRVWAMADALRDAMRENPQDTICALMGECDCPGDEYGIDAERSICVRFANMLADLQKTPAKA